MSVTLDVAQLSLIIGFVVALVEVVRLGANFLFGPAKENRKHHDEDMKIVNKRIDELNKRIDEQNRLTNRMLYSIIQHLVYGNHVSDMSELLKELQNEIF